MRSKPSREVGANIKSSRHSSTVGCVTGTLYFTHWQVLPEGVWRKLCVEFLEFLVLKHRLEW